MANKKDIEAFKYNLATIVIALQDEVQEMVERTIKEGDFYNDKESRLYNLTNDCKRNIELLCKNKYVDTFIGAMMLYNDKEHTSYIEFITQQFISKEIDLKCIDDNNVYVDLHNAYRYFAIVRLLNILTKEQNPPQQQIQLSENVLNFLQTTKCTNGKTYIENATEKPYKWLQNKQIARELLTHDKIKGSLTNADVERQTPNTFIDENNNPLTLAKNKKTPNSDSDNLSNYLATL